MERSCTICKRLIAVDNTEAVYGTAVAFCNDKHFNRWVKRVEKEDRQRRERL